ncbi:MAG: DUF2167 domain-containing protein [Flavobacteriales bacterium]|nr:DUF2167 domain-containing protein [Flavobacteriales bacterium]
MRKFITLIILLAAASLTCAQEDTALTEEIVDVQAIMDSINGSFDYQYGTVELMDGVANINVPEGYKFLNSEQSSYVLSDLWGNPPSECLGMLFPEEISPLSEDFTYAVEITYSDDGYIEDDDAEDINYDDLLEEMQSDAKEENSLRKEEGYPTIELLGWASPPYYDKANKKLHWAKELHFEGSDVNTLNYNIRILGRKGYLNMNAIGDISVLPVFKNDIDEILASVEFNEGHKYSNFDPDIDEVAAYGIGGLIAGKVLAKAGVFAALLKFWKVIAVAVVGAFAALRKRFFGGGE